MHAFVRTHKLLASNKELLDAGLAALYEVPTKRLNEQVKRNLNRVPEASQPTLSAVRLH